MKAINQLLYICLAVISFFHAQDKISVDEPERSTTEAYTFVDKNKIESLAQRHGFDINSKQKGYFSVSVHQEEITSVYPPLMVSSDKFKLFHRVSADSFGVSTYSTDSLEYVRFTPKGSYYLPSFGKYGAYIWMTSLAVVALAEDDFENVLTYTIPIGLYSFPILSLSGMLATTFPDSYIFEGKKYFKDSNSKMWEFGLSLGELPRKYWTHEDYEYIRSDSIWESTNWGGYWSWEWVEKKLPNSISSIGLHLGYQIQFLPFKGSLSIYYVSLEDISGEDYDTGNFVRGQNGDFGLVLFPNIQIPVFQMGRMLGGVSLGMYSQIEFISGGRELWNDLRVWSGGEFELKYYFKPKWALSVTKPVHFFRLESNQQPSIFFGLKYSPHHRKMRSSLNFEQISISPIVQRIIRPSVKEPMTLYGFTVNVHINPNSRFGHSIYTLNNEKSKKANTLYALKYRKYSDVSPRLKAGTSAGFIFSDINDLEFPLLVGPMVEFEINKTLSIWSTAETDVFELIYTMLKEDKPQISWFINAGINVSPFQLLKR